MTEKRYIEVPNLRINRKLFKEMFRRVDYIALPEEVVTSILECSPEQARAIFELQTEMNQGKPRGLG